MESLPLQLGLIWRPALEPTWIFLIAAVLAALATLVYARTWRSQPIVSGSMLAMRLALIGALAGLLMGPSRLPTEKTAPTRLKLCIMLDTSGSMQTSDCGEVSRIEFAARRWLSPENLARLSQHYDAQLIGFDEETRPLGAASLATEGPSLAYGRATHLAQCVQNALARMPSASPGKQMIVISDGRDSEEAPLQQAATLARSRGIAVHTLCLGGLSLQRDIAVLAVPMQEYLLAKEPGQIMVRVYQAGLDQAQAVLSVTNGSDARRIPIAFNGRRVVEEFIPVRHDEPGMYEYSISIEPLPGESETGNNQQVVFCDVTAKRLRVLVVEGQPHWDTKFLAQSLRKDERIELTQVSQVSMRKRETIASRVEDTAASALPRTDEEWAKFDVVILGRQIERVLDEHAAGQLARVVLDRGGHVIMARGQPYDPTSPEGFLISRQLEELEPVEWSNDRERDLSFHMTSAGQTSSWLSQTKLGMDLDRALSRLPGFTSMQRVQREKPATVVWARATPVDAPPGGSESGDPAIVTMLAGRGSVAAVLGEGMWKWSLLERDMQDLSGVYDTFWSNLVRWLAMGGDFAPGQDVSLKLSRSSARLGEALIIDAVYRVAPQAGTSPAVRIVDPNGRAQELELHRLPGREPRFRAEFLPQSSGVHRVLLRSGTAADMEKKFSVYDVNLERLDVSANPAALRALSDQTGGEVFRPEQAGDWVDRLQRRQLAMMIPEEPKYIWDRFWILALMLCWAGVEWIVRRKAGLL